MRIVLFGLLCVWLVAFAWAALWPFDFSRTNLAISIPGRGLEFSPPSIALSDIAPSKIAGLDSFLVVLRFFPGRNSGPGCVLDYTPIDTVTNFRIVQLGHDLEFVFRAASEGIVTLRVPLRHMNRLNSFACSFREGDVTLLDSNRTVGVLRVHGSVGASWAANGRLIFGSSASGKLRWSGTLVAFEVFQGNPKNRILDPGSALMAYRFANHSTRAIPDEGSEPKIPLLVPVQLVAPARKILSSPLSYWDGIWNTRDIFNNFVAFVPFGTLLCLLLKHVGRAQWIVLASSAIAFLLSISVESIQFLVPWRDSSIIDVTVNSLGALCGAWLAALLSRSRSLHEVS